MACICNIDVAAPVYCYSRWKTQITGYCALGVSAARRRLFQYRAASCVFDNIDVAASIDRKRRYAVKAAGNSTLNIKSIGRRGLLVDRVVVFTADLGVSAP